MRRVLSVGVGVFFLAAVAIAQAPKPAVPAKAAAPAAKPAAAAAGKPAGTLAQIMRGLLFPSSNVLFDAQTNDPGKPAKPAPQGGAGAVAQYASVYGGWQAVENAAVALEDAVAVIKRPGRMCQNGKPAPLAQADYQKWANALGDVARKALVAAKAKDQDKIVDIDGDLTEACANCHIKYRDVGDADGPKRCTP